jgi:hypothetical protein
MNTFRKKLKTLNHNFASKENEIKSIMENLMEELRTEYSKKILGIEEFSPNPKVEEKIRNNIMEHYKGQKGEEIDRIDFDWGKRMVEVFTVHEHKDSWNIESNISWLVGKEIDRRGLFGLVEDIVERHMHQT